MTATILENVRWVGLASAVPASIARTDEQVAVFGDDALKIAASTGIKQRRVANMLCTSDLCCAAATRLIQATSTDPRSIDCLVFVSQTPDYLLPATACSLHARLGLAKHCAAFDVNLGCSGYVYGLWLASSLLAAKSARRVLLLVGDTVSRIVSPTDRSTALLFGDAGTATLLETCPGAPPMTFVVGTDGSGAEHLMVPAGSFRRPRDATSGQRSEREGGNVRSDEDLRMDGGEVFAFTLREVPALVKELLTASKWTLDEIDHVVMHQANRFMLEHLGKRLRVPPPKLVVELEQFGNTSSASIPLALTHACRQELAEAPRRMLLAGFGVGWSWAGATVTCGPLVIPEIVEVPVSTNVSGLP